MSLELDDLGRLSIGLGLFCSTALTSTGWVRSTIIKLSALSTV